MLKQGDRLAGSAPRKGDRLGGRQAGAVQETLHTAAPWEACRSSAPCITALNSARPSNRCKPNSACAHMHSVMHMQSVMRKQSVLKPRQQRCSLGVHEAVAAAHKLVRVVAHQLLVPVWSTGGRHEASGPAFDVLPRLLSMTAAVPPAPVAVYIAQSIIRLLPSRVQRAAAM